MASSNNSKTEDKKIKNGETSKAATKTKKDREEKKKEKVKVKVKKKEKEENKKQKNKKLKLNNGNSKQHEKEEVKGKPQEHDKEEVDEVEGGEAAKTHVFPMNRIRTMLKGEHPDLRVSQEALLAINKAAEKFLEQFTQDAYACSVQDRKKSLSYKHLSNAVSKQRRYDFLSDYVPEKVKAEDALRERNSRGNGGG